MLVYFYHFFSLLSPGGKYKEDVLHLKAVTIPMM